MQAHEIAEPAVTARLDGSALDVVQALARTSAPGVVLVDEDQRPVAVLTEAQVIGLFLPHYLRADPALAHVVDEAHADRFAQALAGATVRSLLPHPLPELPVVRHDDTLVETASAMQTHGSPLVVVLDGRDRLVGVVTAHRLLGAMLP